MPRPDGTLPAAGGRAALRRAVAAVCLVGFILVGGSAGARRRPASIAAGTPPAPADTESLVLAGLFSPASLSSLSREEIERAAAALANSARNSGEARERLAMAFPSPQAVLAFLALDRDIDDFVEASDYPGPAGEHYRRAAELATSLRPLRRAYESLYGAAYAALAGDHGAHSGSIGASASAPARLAAKGDLYSPDIRELPHSHPFALDVFFARFDRRGDAHVGPRILSLSDGIVVASASDWRGGAGPANYRGGGLSPAAGNGVVVYDPAGRRYYSYFHLSEVSVHVGQVVEAGRALGRGGNTGFNARRRNHGGHVHIEVFDAARGNSLDVSEILRLLRL